MKACIACKHCISGSGWMSCSHPEVVNVRFDPVYGECKETPLCKVARNGESTPPGHSKSSDDWDLSSDGTWEVSNSPACADGKYFEEIEKSKMFLCQPKPLKPRIINENHPKTIMFSVGIIIIVVLMTMLLVAWLPS